MNVLNWLLLNYLFYFMIFSGSVQIEKYYNISNQSAVILERSMNENLHRSKYILN